MLALEIHSSPLIQQLHFELQRVWPPFKFVYKCTLSGRKYEYSVFFSVQADAVLKGTNIDGVYLCDSRSNNVISEHISFRELASRGASPMDMMAVTFCEENGIPGSYILFYSVLGDVSLSDPFI